MMSINDIIIFYKEEAIPFTVQLKSLQLEDDALLLFSYPEGVNSFSFFSIVGKPQPVCRSLCSRIKPSSLFRNRNSGNSARLRSCNLPC